MNVVRGTKWIYMEIFSSENKIWFMMNTVVCVYEWMIQKSKWQICPLDVRIMVKVDVYHMFLHVSGAEYNSAISTSAEKYQALKFIYTEQKSFKMIYFVIYRSDQKKRISLENWYRRCFPSEITFIFAVARCGCILKIMQLGTWSKKQLTRRSSYKKSWQTHLNELSSKPKYLSPNNLSFENRMCRKMLEFRAAVVSKIKKVTSNTTY